MQPYRKELLDSLGFVWKVDLAVSQAASIAAHVCGDDKKWRQQYDKMVEFHRLNGHCRVPQGCEQDKPLGRWLGTQRTFHSKKKMQPYRKELLDDIGFIWGDAAVAASSSTKDHVRDVSGDATKWRQQYGKLVEFQRHNGHCRVPQRWKQDKPLGRWVETQRTFHSKKKMRQCRKELLDDIGFVWGDAAVAASSSIKDHVRGLVIG